MATIEDEYRLGSKPRQTLDFIRDYIRRRGFGPSVRDIQDGCDISSASVVSYRLGILERAGFIDMGGGGLGERRPSRGIRLLSVKRGYFGGCPLCGCPGHHE